MSKSPADPVEEPVLDLEDEGEESDEYEDIEVRPSAPRPSRQWPAPGSRVSDPG